MIRYFIILTFSLPVFSKGYINITNIPNKCSMGYYDNNEKKYIDYFEGEQWKVNNRYSGCEVSIPKEIFEEKFSICMLTGIEIKTQGGCTLSQRGEEYIFSFDDYSGVSCFYSCELI